MAKKKEQRQKNWQEEKMLVVPGVFMDYMSEGKLAQAELSVYMSLLYYSCENSYRKPTLKELAKMVKVSTKTVSRALDKLCTYGIIDIKRTKRSNGFWDNNEYRFNSLKNWKKFPRDIKLKSASQELEGGQEKRGNATICLRVPVSPPIAIKELIAKRVRKETKISSKEPSKPLRGLATSSPTPLSELYKPIKKDLKTLLDDTRPLVEQAKDYKPTPMLLSRMIERLELANGGRLDGKIEKNRMFARNLVKLRFLPEWLEIEADHEAREHEITDACFKPKHRLPTEDEVFDAFDLMIDKTFETWWEDKIVDMGIIYSNYKKLRDL